MKNGFTLLERILGCGYQAEENTGKHKRDKAFTLAEVLITLVIIGVIGALTVPALIQNTHKQEYVSALKKAYSTLSQAAQAIIAEEGNPKCTGEDGSESGWACSADDVHKYFTKYLLTAKDCGTAEGCFPQQRLKLLNGYKESDNRDDSRWRNFVTADGMQFGVPDGWVNKSCELAFPGGDMVYPKNLCAAIQADVNGAKGPNQIGRDVFVFGLKENGIFPLECSGENTCRTNSTGWSCACKVLTDGALNY